MGDTQKRDHQETRAERREVVRGERFELLQHVEDTLEPVMVGLGLAFLVLLLMDFASVPLVILGKNRVNVLLQAIWLVFLVDFLLRFWIAPEKLAYLRKNWLGALSLVIPFLRPLRAFRAVWLIRQANLVRFLGGINRGIRVVRLVTRGRQFAFVAVLTGIVVVASAVGARYFDEGIPGATIHSFSDALWWSSTLATTMNSELYVVSPEARVIGILIRLYALGIAGYITASIASYLIGADASTQAPGNSSPRDAEAIRGLREEIADLRRALEERG